MKLHVFLVLRRNWKATLSCTNLEKGINTTTLLQHIKKLTKSLQITLEPFGINFSLHYISSARIVSRFFFFLEILEIFHLIILHLWIKVMLYMKDETTIISAITDYHVLAALIGTLKVIVSLEKEWIWGIQKYFSSKISVLVFCGVWLYFCEASKEEKKKSNCSERFHNDCQTQCLL